MNSITSQHMRRLLGNFGEPGIPACRRAVLFGTQHRRFRTHTLDCDSAVKVEVSVYLLRALRDND